MSDREGDPHSPHLNDEGVWNAIKGFWYAHLGWLFKDHLFATDHNRYIPDLLRDPMSVWVHSTYKCLWIPLSLVIPALIGGAVTGSWTGVWLGLVWGGFVRIFIVQHATFSINSICHVFGRRDYRTNDHSRNNLLCALLANGEGWHNNHHAFPASARHGLKWWQFDLSWRIIRTMELLGMAWNVHRPSDDAMSEKRLS